MLFGWEGNCRPGRKITAMFMMLTPVGRLPRAGSTPEPMFILSTGYLYLFTFFYRHILLHRLDPHKVLQRDFLQVSGTSCHATNSIQASKEQNKNYLQMKNLLLLSFV